MERFGDVDDYLKSLLPKRSHFLCGMEREAATEEGYASIARPVTAQLLSVLTRAVRPHRVLELGTAIGYSAILMAEHLSPGGEIITVERDEVMIARARENIEKAGFSGVIRIVEEEAATALCWLEGPFDLIFLDAAKGQYGEFLPDCLRLLAPGGILISDDVLYYGMVAEPEKTVRDKATLVRRLRTYLETITTHPELSTVVLPVEDGVAISVKKEKTNER